MLRRTLTFALAAGLAVPALAQTAPPASQYPATVNLGGSALVLNGTGTRFKFVVKVYHAGLYLARKTGSADEALAMPGPKRVHIVMLREIDANELGRLFTRGMQDNASKEDFSKSIPGTIKMADIFSARKKLSAGETFSVDFVPGTGTQVLVNGKPMGDVIKEPEFFNSLLRIWLGANPADAGLKENLLGREAPRPAGAQQQ